VKRFAIELEALETLKTPAAAEPSQAQP